MLSLFTNTSSASASINKKDVVIVVPVYRHFNQMSEDEKIGLLSAFKHFSIYSFVFIGPESLDYQAYFHFASDHHIEFNFYSFEQKYFSGKDGYSRLLVSKFFYQKFCDYKYMLICQTDAFVFHNDLPKWMDTGYTYIGAPWVSRDSIGNVVITGAGNGGFSLRKVDDFIEFTKRIESLKLLNRSWKKNNLLKKIPFGYFLRLVAAPLWLKCVINKFTYYLSEDALQNEDRYWCEWVSQVFKDFRNAPAWLSAGFAIEEEPQFMMNRLAGALPMGCHAWAINDPEFWKQHIRK